MKSTIKTVKTKEAAGELTDRGARRLAAQIIARAKRDCEAWRGGAAPYQSGSSWQLRQTLYPLPELQTWMFGARGATPRETLDADIKEFFASAWYRNLVEFVAEDAPRLQQVAIQFARSVNAGALLALLIVAATVF